MTLEEAIKRYTSNAFYEKSDGNLQGYLEFNQLVEWLKELKQLKEQTRWIPVSERLPNIHNYFQEYLITNKNKLVGKAFFTETNGRCWWSVDDVIAWMPLPKSFDSQESEG